MIKMMKMIGSFTLLVCSSSLMAETIQGKLGEFYLNGNSITVDGRTYDCNMEVTKVFYNGQLVGEEGLTVGDEVQLVFSDETVPGEPKILEMIILLRGSKKGLDS